MDASSDFKLPVVYRIVETDNFGGDYPDEKFVNLPSCTKEKAKKIAEAINSVFCDHSESRRYWKVVESTYKLQPGFKP